MIKSDSDRLQAWLAKYYPEAPKLTKFDVAQSIVMHRAEVIAFEEEQRRKKELRMQETRQRKILEYQEMKDRCAKRIVDTAKWLESLSPEKRAKITVC